MYVDSLVSINIYNENNKTIINKIPLLYYWNGDGDLLKSILSDKTFKEKYFDNIDFENYKYLQLAYFYFKYDENDNEIYTENTINIFNVLNFNNFNSKKIVYELIIKYMFNLYQISMKRKYDDIKVYNDEIIIDIYTQIKNKYQDKLNKTTFLNWLRSEIISKEQINNQNTNYIIDVLSNILVSLN